MKRKAISKKTRFEIFKRDSFTCQYCGASAPDVVLHVDHIKPVAKGGNNDIMNLVTSCESCNQGKGARKLSDDAVIAKQKEQLDELNKRREQLEMMLEWKEELSELDDIQVEIVNKELSTIDRELTDSGKKNVKKLIKEFGLNEVLESLEIALESDREDIIAYTKRICVTRRADKEDPLLKEKMYIGGILKNRIHNFRRGQTSFMYFMNDYCADEEDLKTVRRIAAKANSWNGFWSEIEDEFGVRYG